MMMAWPAHGLHMAWLLTRDLRGHSISDRFCVAGAQSGAQSQVAVCGNLLPR